MLGHYVTTLIFCCEAVWVLFLLEARADLLEEEVRELGALSRDWVTVAFA